MDAPQPRPAGAPGTTSPAPNIRPTRGRERLLAVDALRGFALLGILMVNMPMFNVPPEVWWWRAPWDHSALDRAAEVLIRVFAEAKFYTLFSFLFGVGMALQMRRILARGGRFIALYVRRLFILLIIGLAHGLLLWHGDILTTYALMGFPLLLLRNWRTRTLLIAALLLYLIPLVFFYGHLALSDAMRLADPEYAAEAAEWTSVWMDYRTELAEDQVEVWSTGTWSDIFYERLDMHRRDLTSMGWFAVKVLAIFIIGFIAGRQGVFEDPLARGKLLRFCLGVGLPLGLLLNLAYVIVRGISDPIHYQWLNLTAELLHSAGAPILTGGYVAIFVVLAQRGWLRGLLRALAAVGRMALTNYLMQTIICTTIFYSFGFGLYGKVDYAAGLLLTLVIYATQVVLSTCWLSIFRFGPAEYIWRTLTYLRPQPLLR